MYRDRGNAEFLARAQNPQCDFAAIGYQDLVEHVVLARGRMASGEWWKPFATRHSRYSIITSGSPNSTGWPSSTRICVTVPALGDGIWFIVFIASMISSVCPTDTLVPTSMNGLAPGSGAQ